MDEAQVWSRADRSRAGGRVANEEECSKRLILGSGFKTTDLVRESKRRFGLVVRLIANKCYRIRSATYPSYLQPSGLCLNPKSRHRRPGNFSRLSPLLSSNCGRASEVVPHRGGRGSGGYPVSSGSRPVT